MGFNSAFKGLTLARDWTGQLHAPTPVTPTNTPPQPLSKWYSIVRTEENTANFFTLFKVFFLSTF